MTYIRSAKGKAAGCWLYLTFAASLHLFQGIGAADEGNFGLHFERPSRHEISIGLVSTTADQYTVEAWARIDSGYVKEGMAGELTVVGQHAADFDAKGTLDIIDGRLRFLINTSAHHDLRSEEEVPVGVWVHLAGVYDGEQMRLFIDAREVAARQVAGNITAVNIRSSLIGGYAGTVPGNSWFWGDLDEVRIWSVARSAEQLDADRFHEIPAQDGLIGYFPFNEGRGEVTLDESGNGRVGFFSNFQGEGTPTWVEGGPLELAGSAVHPKSWARIKAETKAAK